MTKQKKPLTVSEISCADLQLAGEELLAKKYMSYSNQMTNPELAQFCLQMATRHVQNFNLLFHAVMQHPSSLQTPSQQQEWQKLQQQANQMQAQQELQQ